MTEKNSPSYIDQLREDADRARRNFDALKIDYDNLRQYREWQKSVTWIELSKLIALSAIAFRLWL